MKRLMIFASLFALLLSCAKDEGMGVENQPLPEEFTYKVSVDQALKNLDIALANIDGETRSAKRSVKSIERVKASQVMDLTRSADIPQLEDLLYVVSFGEGQGSAVLGADKRVSPVLAIFDETVFEAEDFNRPETRSEIADEGEVRDVETEEELEEFVAGMIISGAANEVISSPNVITDLPISPITPITLTRRDTVVTTLYERTPMLNTKWGQGSPYNNSCPFKKDGITRRPAGCTVIANAQFLKYHQSPNPNVINGESFSWNLINQNYYGGIPSSQAQQEVANYIYCIGRKIGAKYTDNDDSQTKAPLDVFDDLIEEIGLSTSASFISVGLTNRATARNIVMDKGPFCMQGTSDGGAHAWVVDGWNEYETVIKDVYYQAITGTIIREEVLSRMIVPLMHCNMGWSGKCDGYYSGTITGFDTTIPLSQDMINPSIGDISYSEGYNFNREFYMVTY